MLEKSLKAFLPLIQTNTTDIVNAKEVIDNLTHRMVSEASYKKGVTLIGNRVYVCNHEKLILAEVKKLYTLCVQLEISIVFINPVIAEEGVENFLFNAGELPVPTDLLMSLISELVVEEDMPSIIAALGGLTLKDVGELIRLTTIDGQELTTLTLLEMRRQVTSTVSGVQQVGTSLDNYFPSDDLELWLNEAAPFLVANTDYESLVPRGLLFDGPPGVGKTMGAKRIASLLQLPLYSLDIASVLGRYMGDSEGRFSKVLTNIDQQSPCVFLLDEVEKLFNGQSDNAVSGNILAKLLWWLQEHKSRVLTIMTTNSLKHVPPELYRPGRIDQVMNFTYLSRKQQLEFADNILKSYDMEGKNKSIAKKVLGDKKQANFSQAIIVGMVQQYARTQLLEDDEEE